MCGIAGFYAFGNARPEKEELNNLFLEIMDRGKDATGIAWIENGHLNVFKKDITAKEFIKEKAWDKIEIPKMMLMHVRAATNGKPENNVNNHPIFNKQGMALVHNGIISNAEEICKALAIKPDGEVDSEAILKLIEKGWWKDIKELNKLSGGFACAAIWERKPDELILFRHSNPIATYMDKQRDILFWASTTEALKSSFSKYHRGFLTGKVNAYELSDDIAILIDHNGVKDTAKIDPAPRYTQTEFYKYNDERISCWDWEKGQWKRDNNFQESNTKKKREHKIKDKCHKDYCDGCGHWEELETIKDSMDGSYYQICKKCKGEFEGFQDDLKETTEQCPWCHREVSADDRIVGVCSFCGRQLDIENCYGW